MQIKDLYKYGQDEFNYFRCLTAAEKIEFVDSVCSTGVEKTLHHFIALEQEADELPLMVQTIEFRGLGLLHSVFYESELHVYSQSFKAMKLYMKKIFEDGNILIKQQVRKPKDIQERYYSVYTILPSTIPLCLN
jgi:hypothetical protein